MHVWMCACALQGEGAHVHVWMCACALQGEGAHAHVCTCQCARGPPGCACVHVPRGLEGGGRHVRCTRRHACMHACKKRWGAGCPARRRHACMCVPDGWRGVGAEGLAGKRPCTGVWPAAVRVRSLCLSIREWAPLDARVRRVAERGRKVWRGLDHCGTGGGPDQQMGPQPYAHFPSTVAPWRLFCDSPRSPRILIM